MGFEKEKLQEFVAGQLKEALAKEAAVKEASIKEAAAKEKARQDVARAERLAERTAEKERIEAEKEAEKEKIEAEKEAEREKIEARKSAEIEKLRIQAEFEKEREQRIRETERERIRAESEMKREMLDRESEIKRDMLDREAQAKKDTIEAEIELQRLKLQTEEAKKDQEEENEENEGHTSYKATRPKIPAFIEEKDDIDAFLQRFERFAELNKWPETDWSLHLSALLRGQALEVYARLPAEDAKDYKQLKEALLRRYELSADGFRRKFYESRREDKETASEFLCRTSRYLQRWIQLSKAEETYEGLFEMFVKEQFLTTCDQRLSLHLRERELKTVLEVGRVADLFLEARRYTEDGRHKASHNTKSTGNRGGTAQRKVGTKGEEGKDLDSRKCFLCDQIGHISRNCPRNGATRGRGGYGRGTTVNANACLILSQDSVNEAEDAQDVTKSVIAEEKQAADVIIATACQTTTAHLLRKVPGWVNGEPAEVVRDTGCTGNFVRRSLVRDDQMTGKYKEYQVIDGTILSAPTAEVELETPYFSGRSEVLCMQQPFCDVFIGNVEGATDEPKESVVLASAVTTRAQSKENDRPFRALKVSKQLDLEMTREELSKAQREDDSLKKAFKGAEEQTVVNFDKGGKARYEVKKGVLKRIYTSETGREVKQVMVPRPLRQQVISLAHDSILTGHLGVSKTADRILSEFFWPGITSEVTRYCRSCGICQRTIPKGRVSKAPLQKMPVIDEPFRRIAIDIIGPIVPASEKGNRFVLTVVDYATRYPEAIALPSIEAERVAESLLQIYSRVGIPQEILTDQGSNFMSEVLKEVSRLLSIRHLTSDAYHPQCRKLIENFSGNLKRMVEQLCTEKPKDWERYLNSLLFAYREVPNENLQYSPFELLYGRSVRGPMSILRELWTKENTEDEIKSTYQYVVDLRSRIEETCKLVQGNIGTTQRTVKRHFDKKARMRRLEVGDQALILLPTDNNKLVMQWKGPYKIVDKIGATDYKVNYDGKLKVFHINMLKKCFTSDGAKEGRAGAEEGSRSTNRVIAATAIVQELECELAEAPRKDLNLVFRNEAGESAEQNRKLPEGQIVKLKTLLREIADMFSDGQGKPKLSENKLVLTCSDPMRVNWSLALQPFERG